MLEGLRARLFSKSKGFQIYGCQSLLLIYCAWSLKHLALDVTFPRNPHIHKHLRVISHVFTLPSSSANVPTHQAQKAPRVIDGQRVSLSHTEWPM